MIPCQVCYQFYGTLDELQEGLEASKGWAGENLMMIVQAIILVLIIRLLLRLVFHSSMNYCDTMERALALRSLYKNVFLLVAVAALLSAPLILTFLTLYRTGLLSVWSFILSVICTSILVIPVLLFVLKVPTIDPLTFDDVYHKQTPYSLYLRGSGHR